MKDLKNISEELLGVCNPETKTKAKHYKEFATDKNVLRFMSELQKPENKSISNVEKIPTIPITFENYLPERFGKYIEIGDELQTIKAIIESATFPYLIEGDKGIGKTMVVTEACVQTNTALVPYSCSSGTTMGDILGRHQLQGDESVFQLGVVPISMEVANHYGKCVLYLDELSALEPEIQKMMNAVLDDRRSIIVNDRVYKLNDGVKYTVIATTNPVEYQGSNPLNEDFRSRFAGEVWDYPKATDMEKVIDWTDIPNDEVKIPLLQLATDSLALRQEAEVDYVISIRDISIFTKTYKLWKSHGFKDVLGKALKTSILIKYSESKQRELMRKRAVETFGVEIR